VQRDYRYDGAGQLEAIRDTHNGAHSYRYDPVGRLLAATSALGEETFAFDPAGNLLDDARTRHIDGDPARNTQSYTSSIQGRPALLDNLLRDYAGTRYTWDDYGNLVQKQHNGGTTVYTWDGFDRLIQSRDARVTVTYRYDALGRRIVKESSAHVPYNPDAGSGWQELEQKRRNEQYGYGLTLYGWDGDTLAWESSANGGGRTTHYVYEPGSFVPLAQATQAGPVKLHTQPVYGAHYDINEDPLWVQAQEPSAFATVAYYQCDHLGTPQELTDAHGGIAWSAQYRAWGEAKEVISEAARRAGTHNPIRFQGQYADHETGLHYNHHRYYDPQTGRFISKDPIGLAGGINVYQYTPNPVQWIDPLGLSGIDVYRAMKTDSNGAPIAEPTARGLGARPNVDILVDSDGMVHPNTGGMSVAPGSAENLPLHRRPTTLGGKGKDCACRLNTKDLPKGLKYVQDGAAHGTIQPSASMPLPDYQSALGATSNKWVKQ
jgi:RHS repeat-associated protein